MQRIYKIALGLGLLLVLLVGLVSAFYAEEDARGDRKWTQTLQQLRAAGDPTDFVQLVPTQIPDAQNLGSIDLFQMNEKNGSYQPVLAEALTNLSAAGNFPKGTFLQGRREDAPNAVAFITKRYGEVFPQARISSSPLEKLKSLCPTIEELRKAATTRPQCRFNLDYTSQPAFNRPLSNVTEQLQLAKVLNIQGLLYLEAAKPDLALQDVELVFRLDEATRREPVLVSGLVAAGSASIALGTIWEALESHAWTDTQLAELQKDLDEIDFLADEQLCLRGEALGFFGPMIDYFRSHRRTAADLFLRTGENSADHSPHLLELLWWLTPQGWISDAKADGVMEEMAAAREPFQNTSRHLNMAKADEIEKDARANSGWSFPGILVREAVPSVVAATPAFAHAQCRMDEARIACMIERYRLAHGSLPASLDLLKEFGDVPTDLCSGEPYHYSLCGDGAYKLYSVGWNGRDDGGTIAWLRNGPDRSDNRSGDWVWPQPGWPGN